MKNKFSLILFSALLSTTFAWAQTTSAYYEVPAGAFFAGMTENGSAADRTFYLPYNYDQKYIFTSTEDGDWTSGSGSITPNKKDYSYSNRTMKDSCHTPLLKVEGKAGYQYGASGENYDANLYFHIGDSVMHYMTPARIYDEAGSISQKAIDNYYTKTRDTVGVFFNNTDVMYIDSISIPISFGTSTGYSLDAMFPSTATVSAKIYQATQTEGGKSGNKFDRTSAPLRTIELTQECFKKHPSTKYRGVLTATVGEQPLAITGPFVIELTNMKKTGCKFYIYAAKGRSGSNKWGYYVNGTTMTYPGDYTPAISVRAMFPALYTEQSLDVKIPAVGSSKAQTNRPSRKVYANWKYISKTNGWEAATATSGLGISVAFNESSNDWVKWLFTMSANETNDVRNGYVTFKFRGKQLKFHLIQPPVVESVSISKSKLSLKATETETLTASVLPNTTKQTITWTSDNSEVATVDADGKVTAVGVGTTTIKAISLDTDKFATCTVTVTATLTPRTGTDNKQTFTFLAAGDDTLLINGTKTADIYLDSEIKLNSNNIAVESKHGLVKISGGYGSIDNYIRLTLTRKQLVPEEAKDTVVVYFKKNPEINYKYYITQAGCGKLRPDTTSRTFVVGPKGGKALFLNDDNTVGDRYVRLYCDVPATNIAASYYGNHFCTLYHSSSTDAEGHYFKYVSASVEGETTEERLDSFRVYLPGCDTIKFYVRQETTPRFWQHDAYRYTTLEVGNKGGDAHFKGYTTTKMTIVSNTPGTINETEVGITFTDGAEEWITPSKIINSTGDSVFITFDVKPLTDPEPRSTDITVSFLDNEFTVPLTQKTFGIEWSNGGEYDEELVVPVAGGRANWKGSDYYYLNVFGTEAYRDELLVVTAPEGVTINRDAPEILTTGRQRTVFYFSKKDTLTADWSDSIFISFDSINSAENFEYHFKDTIIITQAAAKMWYDDSQSDELSFAAEGEDSEDIKVWANFPFSYTGITYFATNNTGWFSIYRRQDNAVKNDDNYYFLFYIKTKANTEEERNGSVYVALKNKTEIKTETLSFTQLAPEPAPTYIREGSVGNYGTLCFPYTPTQEVTGADFYKVLWFNEPAMDLVLEKITSQPEAGVPYIFQYTADQMVWTYDNAETPVDISATGVNGLHGVASEEGYTVSEEDAIAGTYLLSNNQIVKAAATSHAAQYRAYLRLNEVSTEAPVGPVTAPRIHMTVPGNGAPTNLNGLNSNTKAHKILKDGQLLIIRDTKTYNAQGQIIR